VTEDSAFLYNMSLERSRKQGLELMVYDDDDDDDDVNLLAKTINIKEKSKEAIINASKESGLEVTAQKSKYMFMFRHQNLGTCII
jgi:hypothetical protein